MEKRQLVVVLVNGNINRLRAMASGLYMGMLLKREVKFFWTDEYICLADIDQLFDSEFISKYFVDTTFLDLSQLFNKKDGWSVLQNETILLKGGKLGEQFYMDRIKNYNINLGDYKTIIIISGDIFYLDRKLNKEVEKVKIRSSLYKEIKFNKKLLKEVTKIKNNMDVEYIGIHLRYTDLLSNAPSLRQLTKKIKDICNETGLQSVFIAGDDMKKRDKLIEIVKYNDINCHIQSSIVKKRGTPGSNAQALVDWIMLSESRKLIYFGSTFGFEAGIYGGRENIDILVRSSAKRKIALAGFQIIYRLKRKLESLFKIYFHRAN